jgi:hypothetical protein
MMEIYSVISFWMYVPLVWVIIAIIAVLLELTDGSRVFFLPIGLAALVVAAHLQLVFTNIVSSSLLPEAWYWLAMEWMIVAAAISVLLVVFRTQMMPGDAASDDEDINRY